MANSTAFTYTINPIGTGAGENNSVHQVSPAWVLTFVRWNNRDTYRTTNVSSTEVRDPLVVENDCVQCSTTSNKGTLTPSMTATLIMTDINYETSVAPGDFVFVNMLNFLTDARRVADAARAKAPINGLNDGFKGIYKVQSVRKSLATDPESGKKFYIFKVTGFAFTEFNNSIYFNPFMLDPSADKQNPLLFASIISTNWANLYNKRSFVNVQDLMAVLIQNFIGTGVSSKGKTDKNSTLKNFNTHFFIPKLVGKYLGVDNAKAAKDVYNFLFGIQKYAGQASNATSLTSGLNPQGLYTRYNRFWYTQNKCDGDSILKAEYWNNVKAWSIINQYTNSPLNEIYTCFRVSPEGTVMPTMVFRQIPFTTESFKGTTLPTTKFMNLPRWKVDPSLVLGFDIGREEAARINFVQYFATSTIDVAGTALSLEIAKGNYSYDIKDVQRSGLRPYIIVTQFNEPSGGQGLAFKSPLWAKIMGDSLIGGHLKMNGTINTVGLVDPIATGDNFEFDGVVYHIEQVTHTCLISPEDGKKSFRTSISLSSGVSVTSSSNGTRYDEMVDPKAQQLRIDDYANNALLPGQTESQDTVYRVINPDIDDKGAYSPKNNNPFPQPNTKQGGQKPPKGKGGPK
jgi:hypothetical protein